MSNLNNNLTNLLWLVIELEHMLTLPRVPGGGRNPGPPGPTAPVPAADIDLRLELEDEIRDVVTQIHSANEQSYVHLVGKPLSAWVRWLVEHQHWLYAHPEPQAVEDTVAYWTHRLANRIDPRDERELANQPEPWLNSRTIRIKLERKGHRVSADRLRQWAHRGHIASKTMQIGGSEEVRYRLSDVLSYLLKPDRSAPKSAKI
ncbi:hypothetical protein CMUST_15800 (plasmid) [Corynebacterium mustelae]|uniref:Uncharacterized protein n=1 Tax=Corynebacterium mustelae TaxID=571915 RepID=A0A0G3GVP4_9CORY|nr:hypothetical protein [Corynebacterium mustelae]AKK05226.1 hypothetical protein CMUST_04420 [Corynebacterium mustelae]AKK07448.1 hypothetical protein CMUST_15800 [Corynebacterium mustelae]